MKLDVSDVLYDSSSVSSDSGTSQSSRVSHDFLSSIASTAVLPNNVSIVGNIPNMYRRRSTVDRDALFERSSLFRGFFSPRERRPEFQPPLARGLHYVIGGTRRDT